MKYVDETKPLTPSENYSVLGRAHVKTVIWYHVSSLGFLAFSLLFCPQPKTVFSIDCINPSVSVKWGQDPSMNIRGHYFIAKKMKIVFQAWIHKMAVFNYMFCFKLEAMRHLQDVACKTCQQMSHALWKAITDGITNNVNTVPQMLFHVRSDWQR